jgi:hypothetical protein
LGFTLIRILAFPENIFQQSPLTQSIFTFVFNSYGNILNLVLGALIASMVGLFSSVAMMDLKSEEDRDNLIFGFYYEIKQLTDKIRNISSDDLSKCAIWLQLEKEPVYYDSGLFFVFRKEIFSFEPSLLEKLLSVYSKIIFIEEQRKNLHLEKPTFDKNTPDIVNKLKIEIDELLQLLEKEKVQLI